MLAFRIRGSIRQHVAGSRSMGAAKRPGRSKAAERLRPAVINGTGGEVAHEGGAMDIEVEVGVDQPLINVQG